MRVLGVLAVTLIGMTGMTGAGFWAARHGEAGSWMIGPTSLATATAVLALSLVWSLPGDPRTDPRWRRRWNWISSGCAISGVANAAWVGALLGARGVHPTLVIVGALAVPGYIGLALLIGERLRRVEVRTPQYWQRTGPRPVLFGVAMGAVLAGAMQFGLGRADGADPLAVLPFAVQTVVLGAFGGTLVRVFPLSFAVNRALGADPAIRRAVSKAVLQNRPVPDEHLEIAARYADIGRHAQAWLLAMLVLIYVMNATTQLRDLVSGEHHPLQLILVLGLTALFAFCLPVVLRQQRRLARYSDAHPVTVEAVA